MKIMKLLSLLVIFSLILSVSVVAYGGSENQGDHSGGGNGIQLHDRDRVCDDCCEQDQDQDRLRTRDQLHDCINDLTCEFEEYKYQYQKTLKNNPDNETDLQVYKNQLNILTKELVQTRNEIKQRIRENYTNEEIQLFNNIKFQLQANNPDITVLDIDSIMKANCDFKFDFPPIIKDGRTLIPIRQLTEALGAEVIWNANDKEVTIQFDDTVIVLTIGSDIAYVNREQVQLETKAQVMNNHTIVPLRFIAETKGISVVWDPESESILLSD